jgi:hypothetical protein
VILATGYERRSHRDLLAPLQGYLQDFSVERDYRALSSAELQAPVYLQGFCETSHGLSDTLLSVLPAARRKSANRCTRHWRSTPRPCRARSRHCPHPRLTGSLHESSTSGALRQLLGLLRPFWPTVTIATLLGMLGGLSITALLATINNGLHSDGGLQQGVVLAFAGLCAVALVSSICSDIGTNYVGQHVIAALRKQLGEKVLAAPIEQIERTAAIG